MNDHVWKIATAVLVLIATQARSAVRYVDLNNTAPAAPYTSWATAATNIQDAVNAAIPSDEILVTNGVYRTGATSSVGSNRVAVTKAVQVRSVNGPTFTFIEGYQLPVTTNGIGAIRCVYLADGATLSGFTLTNGATETGGFGGGVYCQSFAGVLVSNCVMTANVSGRDGGGSFSGRLINCILRGNRAQNGGGSAGGQLNNCILTGNSAVASGGGAYYSGPMNNCTVVSNFAGFGGGGGEYGASLNNCILYYNTTTGSGTNHANSSLINCCTVPTTGVAPSSGNISNPPLFVDMAAGNFRLQPWSPCINAGTNFYAPAGSDADGLTRIVNGTVDIGAYELQTPAAKRFVNVSNATPVSPFTNWIYAATNIQDAINVASSGELIVVSNGVYATGGQIVPEAGIVTNRVALTKALIVQSVNGPSVTLIQGGSAARGAYLTNNAVISGFTLNKTDIRGGATEEARRGGGAWCRSSTAIVTNCVLADNLAGRGGGAFRGTLLDCVITNSAFGGGGAAAFSNILVNCTLINNATEIFILDASFGGAAGYCSLTNCVVTGNYASDGGGAYVCTLTSCLISSNAAIRGAGAYQSILNNCVLFTNTATGDGGGTYLGTLNNCVVVSNKASGYGSGSHSGILNNCVLFRNSGFSAAAFNSTLNNCTVVSNVSGGAYSSTLNNCVVYYNGFGNANYSGGALTNCCTTPLPGSGTGNFTNPPLLVSLAGNSHLQSNSPCINSGNNAAITNLTDLDGNPRIAGGTVDVGAYEFQSPASILSYAWLQQYGLPTDGSVDYTDTDGDGHNSWQEWRTSTDPTDISSVLQMLTVSNDVSGVTVSWKSVGGLKYFLQRSSDLRAPPAFQTLITNLVGQAGSTSYTDTNAVGKAFFYRAGVQ